MKVVETIYTGYDWKSGEENVDRCVEVALYNDEGKRLNSVSFSEGEPEDMTLYRDLSDAYTIYDLVRAVYEYGRKGVEIQFEKRRGKY